MNNKILIVGPFFPPINGCSLANEVFVENLKKNNIVYDYINTSSSKLNSKELGKFSLRKIISFLGVYTHILKMLNCKIIYTTPGQTFWGLVKYAPFYLVALILKKPYIIHVHGNFLGTQYQMLQGVKKRIFYYLVANCSAGVVLSKDLIPNFDGLLPINKIFVVENFAQNELMNASLEKKSDFLRILFMSNLMKEKGIINFLDALLKLKAEGVKFEAKIAGKIENGLEKIINEKLALLVDEVEYYGVVKGQQKVRLFQEANVFCLPTYYNQEGQPISILEGMATKNIIVTTKHAGIPDICSNDNAFFCEKNNTEDLIEKLQLISTDIKNLSHQMGNINYNKVLHHFTEEMFSKKLIKILDHVSKTK